MKKAIEQCAEQCHPPAERVFLPTRLIDLGQDPAKDCPRLVITADSIGRPQELLEPVKYVALSYCWGAREEAATQLQTESQSLEERLRAIPLATMSPVMQQVILVCGVLSVH